MPLAPLETPALVAALDWKPLADTADLGMPSGCRLQLPVRAADVEAGTLRLLAAPLAASELVLALDHDDDGHVDRAGIVPLSGGSVRPVPWASLDNPPAFAHGLHGWIAIAPQGDGAARQAILWREGGPLELLASGDGLEPVDALCAGTHCAVLTSLAATVAGSGATVFWGDPSKTAASWQRTDIRPDGKGRWTPFNITAMSDANSVDVALREGRSLGAWTVRRGRLQAGERLQTGPVAYDAIVADEILSVHAGEPVVLPCRKDGFALEVRTPTARWAIQTPAPPDSVATRRLGERLLLTWIGPASCRRAHSPLVHAALLTRSGHPTSSAMAVGYASGFAVSTRGQIADYWLQRDQQIVWARADCSVDRAIQPLPEASAGVRSR